MRCMREVAGVSVNPALTPYPDSWPKLILLSMDLAAVQSLNSINDQIASFIVTGPKPVEPDQPVFPPPEKEPLQKSMTLMRHLLVDAQERVYIRRRGEE
ncbi:hypothetical protein KUCAC02_012515, partial [Chaenocephalus aceratus]